LCSAGYATEDQGFEECQESCVASDSCGYFAVDNNGVCQQAASDSECTEPENWSGASNDGGVFMLFCSMEDSADQTCAREALPDSKISDDPEERTLTNCYERCLQEKHSSVGGCSYFTYHEHTQLCELFSACARFTNAPHNAQSLVYMMHDEAWSKHESPHRPHHRQLEDGNGASRQLHDEAQRQLDFRGTATGSESIFCTTPYGALEKYSQLQTYTSEAGRAASDVALARHTVVLCGFLLAIALSFATLWAMSKGDAVPSIMTAAVVLLLLCLFSVLVVSGINSGYFTERDAHVMDDRENMLNFRAVFWCALIVILTVIYIVVNHLAPYQPDGAIRVLSSASESIVRLPTIALFGLLPVLCCALLILYWISVSVLLASCETSFAVIGPDGASYTDTTPDYYVDGLGIFLVFGLLWGLEFFKAVGSCATAGAICEFYFRSHLMEEEEHRRLQAVARASTLSADDSFTGGRCGALRGFMYRAWSAIWTRCGLTVCLPPWFVCNALHRACRFHIGTLAVGSLVIPIVVPVRVLGNMFRRIAGDDGFAPVTNPVLRVASSCSNCCLGFVEHICCNVSHYAFILTAMKGLGLSRAGVESHRMKNENDATVGLVSYLSYAVLMLCKLSIAVLCTTLGFFSIDHYGEVTSPVAPLMVIFLMSFTVASTLLGVLEITADTLMFCMLEDKANPPNSNKTSNFQATQASGSVYPMVPAAIAPDGSYL
jgi:hypothetical protein